MTRTRRILLAALPTLALAAYLGSTWLLGMQADNLLADTEKKLEHHLPFVKISERKFERGFFTSTETAKVTLGDPGREIASFTLKSTVRHGPLPGLGGIGAAEVDSELSLDESAPQPLKNWLGTGVLLAAQTTMTLSGKEGESRLAAPGFKASRFAWDGAAMRITFARDLSRFTVQGDIPSVRTGLQNGPSLKVANAHFESEHERIFGDAAALYSGSDRLTISRLDLDPGTGPGAFPALTAGDINISDAATRNGDEHIDYRYAYSAKTLEINNQNYGPARLDVAASHLHARTLSDLLRNGPAASGPRSAAEREATLQKLARLIQGANARIERMSFATPHGDAVLSASVAASEPVGLAPGDPASLIRALDIRVDAAVPEESARSLLQISGAFGSMAQVDARIREAIADGYVTRDGAMLMAGFEFRNNQRVLNGPQPEAEAEPDPGPESEPGAEPEREPGAEPEGETEAVPDAAPTAEPAPAVAVAPAAERKMNCVACHAKNHKVVGPSWADVAARYRGATDFEYNGQRYPLVEGLVMKVSKGGAGRWGNMPMPSLDPGGVHQEEIGELVRYILNVAPGASPSPAPAGVSAQQGRPSQPGGQPDLARRYNCVACHAMDKKIVGPSWKDIAARYRGASDFEYDGLRYPLVEGLVLKVSKGGNGHWGSLPMPRIDPNYEHQADMTALVRYVLGVTGSSGTALPAAPSGELASVLVGTWTWGRDRVVFESGGRGVYFMGRTQCFAFSYTVQGDVLTETADQLHSCGAGLVNRYRISIDGNRLTQVHIGSSYETNWRRAGTEGD